MADAKKRHGCLTAWLIVMLVSNSAMALFLVLVPGWLHRTYPNAPDWAWPGQFGMILFSVVSVVALFRWQKWGFWVFCMMGVLGVIMGVSMGQRIGTALLGLIAVLLLYGVLHIGKENKGWPQLD